MYINYFNLTLIPNAKKLSLERDHVSIFMFWGRQWTSLEGNYNGGDDECTSELLYYIYSILKWLEYHLTQLTSLAESSYSFSLGSDVWRVDIWIQEHKAFCC